MSKNDQTVKVPTADEAAAMFVDATTSAKKWEFLDGVAAMCAANPDLSQRDVVDMIGSTDQFIQLHGDFRDRGTEAKEVRARNARSRLTSIRSELSVVKVWPPSQRVEGVSLEAHKVLNRIGADEGRKILTALAKERGGPGNVTKKSVADRLKALDPDHQPRPNGKKASATSSPDTASTLPTAPVRLDEYPLDYLAEFVSKNLDVTELSKNQSLLQHVEVIADKLESYLQREAAKGAAKGSKAAPKKKAASKKAAPRRRQGAAGSAVKPKRPSVRAPKVKAPVG